MKCIRPDKLVNSLTRFFLEQIDRKFVEPVHLKLVDVYRETEPKTPIFFLVAHAANPYQSLL